MEKNNHPFEIPPLPTDKRRIVFSFAVHDREFFKCFPSDTFLGTRYDRNPAQLLIQWDLFLRPYNCQLQIFNPRGQLLVSFPIAKSINQPWTIVDGMINEWVTKEEYVEFQFVFTKDTGEFVKSTIPVRMEMSPANKPDYMKIVKPTEFDMMKALYDQAIVKMVLRFDEVRGWVYDCFSQDGTLKFSLDWIPAGVVRFVNQVTTPNERMIARENIRVPFTFVLSFIEDDCVQGDAGEGEDPNAFHITKETTKFVNELRDATFEVWKDNGNETFTEVTPISKTYSATGVTAWVDEAFDGYIRVSCRSIRFIPDDEGNLVFSALSGNLVMGEDEQTAIVGEEQNG